MQKKNQFITRKMTYLTLAHCVMESNYSKMSSQMNRYQNLLTFKLYLNIEHFLY